MKKHIRTILLILMIVLFSIFIYGCSRSDSVLYNPDTAEEEKDFTDILGLSDSLLLQHVQEIRNEFPEFDQQKYPWIGLMCFSQTDEETGSSVEIDMDNLTVHNGTIDTNLTLMVYYGKEADYNVSGAFVLIWNGLIYDFSVDGKQSTDGFLKMDLPFNQDFTFPFRAEHLPVQTGENTLCFCFFPYCKEKGMYLTPQRMIGHYQFEEAQEGCAAIVPETENMLHSNSIETVTDRSTIDALYSVSSDDIISTYENGSSYIHLLRRDPTFYFNILNMQDEKPYNRSGIMMLFADGELYPIWNGSKYASVSLKDNEYLKKIAFKTDLSSGEQHDLLMVYTELQCDPNPYGTTFIYSDGCSCKIEE